MKVFGTDGVRGAVGQWPMTPEFVLKLGWAAGMVLGQEGRRRVLIGKDTRISGYMFESALEAGFSAAGVDVRLLGPMPTPAIAYLTRTLRGSAGVVISASHNPFHDNGVKFFSASGEKLPDAIEAQIEAMLDEPMTVAPSNLLGKAQRIDDAPGRYIEFCKSSVEIGLSLANFRIVVDCAHGAGYQVAPRVFTELGAEVIRIGVEPDGLNINSGVGSTEPAALQRAVAEFRADLGIALDGDGDRVLMVDGEGRVLDGDKLLYIIAADRVRRAGYAGGVVGTQMSNLGLEQAIKKLGLPFLRAKVGDRHVHEALKHQGWLLGGESSGHILCLDRHTTGDGIIAALQVVSAVKHSGKPLHQLAADVKIYPQTLINIRTDQRVDFNHPAIVGAVQKAEQSLGDRGRVLLRASGTEPLIRVMVEGESGEQVALLAQNLANEIRAVSQS
ncbi:MAG: phosphoglucosamine mutase [Halothiobacillus sp. 24-54-40]|nr:MAG: phosphoglucosamine mutase [Halothiobacillus sp. 35-54-62]OYY56488.1 MAG: phosphoglucosamine mutase [Halothiobacillus sp. 28-55-5]OYZ88452.1 MAG: phosphoglucosamine mutase [Halothiobacillus sp. 24-54-40]OZA81761.1 MAG: phosphoglucosamine mutase [Halothiobacillus sp. 39-53-45]HQS01760.1 phosphoglucosamine mutase [Halothiobacillus sp.]